MAFGCMPHRLGPTLTAVGRMAAAGLKAPARLPYSPSWAGDGAGEEAGGGDGMPGRGVLIDGWKE